MLHSFIKLHVFFVFFLIMANSAVASELKKITTINTSVTVTCPSHIFETADAASGWSVTKFQSNFDHAEFSSGHLFCYYKPNNDPQLIYTSSKEDQNCETINGKDSVSMDISTDVSYDGFMITSGRSRSYSKTKLTSSETECYYKADVNSGMFTSSTYSSCDFKGRRATCKP